MGKESITKQKQKQKQKSQKPQKTKEQRLGFRLSAHAAWHVV
jgi:hypothetical protein